MTKIDWLEPPNARALAPTQETARGWGRPGSGSQRARRPEGVDGGALRCRRKVVAPRSDLPVLRGDDPASGTVRARHR